MGRKRDVSWAGERSISEAKDWERVCGARERGEWGERKRGLSRARERERGV